MPSPNLKNVYDNSNKITSSGLSVTYKQTFNGSYWEIARYAKKAYSFVGMDKDTAYECAAAKRAQYTRAFARLDTSVIDENHTLPDVVFAYECPSDIAPQHQDGDIWSVEIQVNEEDHRASGSAVSNPAALFPQENARSYDEDAGLTALSLDSISRSDDKATVSYTTSIANFKADSLVLQYKTEESSTTWTSSSRDKLGRYSVPSSGTFYARLIYGSFESNTLTVE